MFVNLARDFTIGMKLLLCLFVMDAHVGVPVPPSFCFQVVDAGYLYKALNFVAPRILETVLLCCFVYFLLQDAALYLPA